MAAQNYSNLKMEVIDQIAQRELEFMMKLVPTVTDVSRLAIPGSSSISFPKLSSFTVNDRAFGAADTEQTLSDTKDTLLLDKNKIVSFIIDAADDTQATIDAMSENAKRAASAIARQVDTDIIALLEASSNTATTAADITRDVVLEMQEFLFDAEGRIEDMVLVVGNDQHSALLKIAEFTEHQVYNGLGQVAPNQSGQLGTVYGVPVIRHSGLAANRYYMYNKEGVAYGSQRSLRMESEQAISFGTGARRVATDHLYGVQELQGGDLIIKDGNA